MRGLAFGFLLMLVPSVSESLAGVVSCDRALRTLEGWTIVKVASVRGAFEGCDYDRLIELADGTILRCSSYGYQYAYTPDAVIFAKPASVNGAAFTMVKMLVDGEMYDMQPIAARQ